LQKQISRNFSDLVPAFLPNLFVPPEASGGTKRIFPPVGARIKLQAAINPCSLNLSVN